MKNIIKARNILFALIILIGAAYTSVAYTQYVTNDTNGTNDTKINSTNINSTNISKKTVSINIQVEVGKGSVDVYRNNESIGSVNDGEGVKTFTFEIWDRFRFEAMPGPGYNYTKFCPEGGPCLTDNPFVGTVAGEGNLYVRFSNGEDINNSSGKDINNSNAIVTQTVVQTTTDIKTTDAEKRTEKSPAISFIVSIFVIIILALGYKNYKK